MIWNLVSIGVSVALIIYFIARDQKQTELIKLELAKQIEQAGGRNIRIQKDNAFQSQSSHHFIVHFDMGSFSSIRKATSVSTSHKLGGIFWPASLG